MVLLAGMSPDFCVIASHAAQTERENIRQRQAEGVAAANGRGRFGPPPQALPDNFEEPRQAWRNKRMSPRAAAETCGLPKSTFRDAVLRAEMAVEFVAARRVSEIAYNNGRKNILKYFLFSLTMCRYVV